MPTTVANRQSVAKAQSKWSDVELQAHLDEMSQRHMEASTDLEYTIEGLFKHQDKLPDGTTKEQVTLMTQFKQIELLERLADISVSLGITHVSRSEICQFVEEVDKDGFRTADDFGEPEPMGANSPQAMSCPKIKEPEPFPSPFDALVVVGNELTLEEP